MADDARDQQILGRLHEQLDQSRQQEERLKEALNRVLSLFASEAAG